ncbi:MAG: glycogen/starch/alpha-glucan phosphorylase [Isosphaeraceae bacterium]
MNVARSGKFSSDRTIGEYAKSIWRATPCPVAWSDASDCVEAS